MQPHLGPALGPVLGLDIGGTKIAAGLVLPDGSVQHLVRAPTPARAGREAILATAADLLSQVRRAARDDAGEALATGVATAGVVDDAGRIVGSTAHLGNWVGADVADALVRATGTPTTVLNDVHAHALGEAWAGAGAGLRSVLVVAVGTGVGGGLVVDGVVHSGVHGAAGHLGHIPCEEAAGVPCPCGRVGHLEAVASGPGLAALYGRRAGHTHSADVVLAEAEAGQPVAIGCVETAGTALGRAVGGWVNTLDPDVVVVGGGLASAGPLWWSYLRAGMREECIPLLRSCPIVPSQLGGHAPLIGAARAAMQRLDLAVTA